MKRADPSSAAPARSRFLPYAAAGLSVAAAVSLRILLDPLIGARSHMLLFALATTVAARFGGRGPGLAATAVCVPVGWYFFTEPRMSWGIAEPADAVNLVLFAVCGVFISVLSGQLRQALGISRRSEEQMRRFAESAPVGLAMFDCEMRYLAASERFRQDYGLEGPFEGRSHYEVFPEIPERWREIHRRVLAGSVEACKEDPFERADGTLEWVRWEMRPWHHVDGSIGGAVLAAENITFRKEAETALRESEQRFRSLFEQAGDGLYIATADGTYAEVNARGLELSGYTREEFLRMRVVDFVAPSDRGRLPAELEAVRAGRKSIAEWQFVRKDGSTFPGEVNARLMPDGRVLAIVRDLTERRRLEDQFRQAQKLEGIGRLAGGVAHDFNNLLTVIGGYARMGLDELPMEDPLRDAMAEIERAADRAAALTRQLLAFSRNRLVEVRTIVVDHVVRDFEKMLRRIIGEDIELRLALDATAMAIRADPGKVEQVILNLAVNARDAMPHGGKLVIETSNFQADDEFAEAHLGVAPGPHIALAVSDTGTGMSAEVKAKLFEPFFTTKEPGKGTGLGLSTVYGIVRQSGGSIWVYSEPGHGSTFRILFPAVGMGNEAAEPPVEAVAPDGTETILLVEDDNGVRKYIRRVLERRGYSVVEAGDGREALDLARSYPGRFDLLLTDIVMPEVGGIELAARFGGPSGIPVLCISGYSDRLWPSDAAAVTFLQKPFTPGTLLRRVRESLGGRLASGGSQPS